MRNLHRSVIFAAGLLFVRLSLQPIAFAQDRSLQIAYEMNNPDDICVSDIEGNLFTCLTSMIGEDKRSPVWSPDGQRLTYQTYDKFAAGTAYIADLKTQAAKKLELPFYSTDISAWYPDGDKLLLMGTMTDARHTTEIYSFDIESGQLHPLTQDKNSCYGPKLSPDGQKIAYVCGYPEKTLNIMAADGSQPHVIVDHFLGANPVWSPDGKKFAFIISGALAEGHQISEIYVMDADGSNMHQLTDTGRSNVDPQWSPDGKQIIFWSFAVGAFSVPSKDPLLTEIYRMDADGNHLVDLTQSEGLDYDAVWSPDGQWIAFASLRAWKGNSTGQAGIFVMRSDGSDVQMVSNLPPESSTLHNEASNPVWRPILSP